MCLFKDTDVKQNEYICKLYGTIICLTLNFHFQIKSD